MFRTEDITVLRKLVIINLDVNIWSARRRLTPADFHGAKLPPEKLASLGSKKICNPESLKIFGRLKARAVTALDRAGVRFLGGWAIPQSKAQEVVDVLKDVRTDFLDAKDKFLASYDENITDWINHNLEWSELIQNSLVSAGHVSNKFGFTWQLYQIAPPKKAAIHNSLRDEVAQLGNTLYAEVAKEAESIWKLCYSGKDQVSQKAVSPIRSLYQKLEGLSFIEPCAGPICDLIKTAFSKLPASGFITGTNLFILQGLLSLLRDPVTLVEHGKLIISGVTASTTLHNLIAQRPISKSTNTQEEMEEDLPINMPQAVESLGLW